MTESAAASFADPALLRTVVSEAPAETRKRGTIDDLRYAGTLLKRFAFADPVAGAGGFIVWLGIRALASMLLYRSIEAIGTVQNVLAARDRAHAYSAVLMLIAIVLAQVVSEIAGGALGQLLQFRLRSVLTRDTLQRWLAADCYYHLERHGGVDHPEQRIQEDIALFGQYALTLLASIISIVLPIYLYAGKLWSLAPPLSLAPVGLPFVLEGWLIYATVAFALFWTLVTHLMGLSLTRAEVVRQKLEATLRDQLHRVRINGEAIAFENGAPIERERAEETLTLVSRNWYYFIYASAKLNVTIALPEPLWIFGPGLVLAPLIASGQMQIGDVSIVGTSISLLMGAVGVLIFSYDSIAILRSVTARLGLLEERMATLPASGIARGEGASDAVEAQGLRVDYPDGAVMVDVGDLTIGPGDRLMIRGPSGAGKSTLLRALAGLWPYGIGTVALPDKGAAKLSFLPQRAYMPEGTLAALLAYPKSSDAYSHDDYAELLDRMSLSALRDRVDEYADWQRILSPGEQQRVAAIRAVLAAPDFLFVDEATSALDADSEAALYRLLTERLPHAAIVSIAHRPAVAAFHRHALTISNQHTTMSALSR